MNIRQCKDGSNRLRFYHAHTDHIEMIQSALKRAGQELGTEFDTVALVAICMNYLSGSNVIRE